MRQAVAVDYYYISCQERGGAKQTKSAKKILLLISKRTSQMSNLELEQVELTPKMFNAEQ